MIKYVCDRCQALMEKDRIRYQLKIELFAAYDGLEIKETEQPRREDIKKEIADLLKQMEEMDEEELQDQVHVKFEYDLCQKCRDKIYERHKHGEGLSEE